MPKTCQSKCCGSQVKCTRTIKGSCKYCWQHQKGSGYRQRGGSCDRLREIRRNLRVLRANMKETQRIFNLEYQAMRRDYKNRYNQYQQLKQNCYQSGIEDELSLSELSEAEQDMTDYYGQY